MLQLSHKTIQTIKTAFHLILIAVITFQFLSKAFYALPDDWLFFFTSDAVENFVCALIAYFIYYFVLKLHGIWKKIGLVIGFAIILILLGLLKDYRIFDTITFERTFNFFTNFLGKALLFYSGIYFVNRLEFLNRYKKLETELNQAKAQLLRNQFNPHFLFNAFNSLYSMSLKNHPKTPDTILKLSGMMRYLTDDSTVEKVKLTRELQFIEDYITVEKIRFGEKANITFSIEGNPEGKQIEPLLLMTFVENAFKHGFYTNDVNAFVSINVVITDEKFNFTVENSIQQKQHFQKEKREGKGLENIKKRLKLSHPKTSKLTLTEKDAVYLAELEITLI